MLVFSNSEAAKAADTEAVDAVEAMHRGDFAKAYCIMRPLAEAGDAESQFNIGWMYLNGYGLRVDGQQALQWWMKASDQGHTDASFSLGMLYSTGEGKVARDLNKAIDYYKIAAQDGQEDAVKMLKYLIMRNDKQIRSRLHEIVNQYGTSFGIFYRVNVKELNVREKPSVKAAIVARLAKGQKVLELSRKGEWSQVVVIGKKKIDQTVWLSNQYLKK
jgi:TPR repeat protein